ncbi:C-type lectin BML-2-like [Gigantopelta aegis]|uniref:C-type lectin BML-2-like n=1 Tax=Gigantopelta aegis TaxID=1735272 RepID=UPI001B88A4AA|nr:C-type lectin BML-2-like [Gigantopelta aegis]
MDGYNLLFCSHNTRQSVWIYNSLFDDIFITDDVISSIRNVNTQLDCGKECTKRAGCNSFSHNSNDGTCSMHSARFTNSASYLPSQGSRHYSAITDVCPVQDGYVLLRDLNLCFKVFNVTKTMSDARDLCNQSGSRLIVLDTAEKNDAVSAYIVANIGQYNYYIGLTDEDHEDVFVWEDGSVVSDKKWMSGEPNNSGNANCVILKVKNTLWNDIPCSRKRRYICEKAI